MPVLVFPESNIIVGSLSSTLAWGIIYGLPFYLVIRSVYNVFFHPLAKIPGPKLYALTELLYLYHLLRGDWNILIKKCHEQYGPVVRTTPNDVSFTTAEASKQIYGHKVAGAPNFEKDTRFYFQGRPAAHILSAGNEDHRRIRRTVAHAFSDKALRNQEPVVNKYVNLFIERLTQRAASNTVVDMVAWFNFATFDLIGDLAFGKPFGSLESGTYHPWVLNIFRGMKGAPWTQVSQRLRLRWLFRWLVPQKYLKASLRHRKFAELTALARIESGDTKREDFMSYILRHNDERGMSKGEIVELASILVLAGSETTATLLSGATFLLLTNRDKYEKLTKEIRSAFSSPDEITINSVNQLKYLLAVFNEAARIYPPVPIGLPRIVPDGGEVVEGYWLPGGTVVSVPHVPAYHSERNFRDSKKFVPERWLDDPIYRDDERGVLQPFSSGPRNCIGKNLAYSEMRLLMTNLLWKFDLELMPGSEDWLNQNVYILWSKKSLNVRLTEVTRDAKHE
ncbi:unnamed protein product [Clonostachys rosea]|uniref:Cytochrome P450 monooxygenase n=1 Tax=Bionectria ochroleuca TaxID=29856 RepID=A0ABY6V270_BIOOC|nr:unnamed protein product [Clonostachys rosea]